MGGNHLVDQKARAVHSDFNFDEMKKRNSFFHQTKFAKKHLHAARHCYSCRFFFVGNTCDACTIEFCFIWVYPWPWWLIMWVYIYRRAALLNVEQRTKMQPRRIRIVEGNVFWSGNKMDTTQIVARNNWYVRLNNVCSTILCYLD